MWGRRKGRKLESETSEESGYTCCSSRFSSVALLILGRVCKSLKCTLELRLKKSQEKKKKSQDPGVPQPRLQTQIPARARQARWTTRWKTVNGSIHVWPRGGSCTPLQPLIAWWGWGLSVAVFSLLGKKEARKPIFKRGNFPNCKYCQ